MAHLRIQKMTFRGFGFLVPRMRNQQIFEANSGFKICLLRFHFSMFEAKLASNLRPFLASKIGSVSAVFKRALGLFLCLCPWSPQEISKARCPRFGVE